jgi:hypothetical protein
VADMATKILSSVTTLRFTKIVLGHHTWSFTVFLSILFLRRRIGGLYQDMN